MIFSQTAVLALIVILAASLIVLVSERWYWSLGGLALQYVGVFWLVANNWPLGLSLAKLVVGWMAVAVIAASRSEDELREERFPGRAGQLFRGLAAILVWALVFSVAPQAREWFPVQTAVLQGGMLLAGMGLLHLGMTARPQRVVMGLLTVIAGFEVLYSGLERSVLVAGLLGVVNLGLALAGSYGMLSGQFVETPPDEEPETTA